MIYIDNGVKTIEISRHFFDYDGLYSLELVNNLTGKVNKFTDLINISNKTTSYLFKLSDFESFDTGEYTYIIRFINQKETGLITVGNYIRNVEEYQPTLQAVQYEPKN